MAKLWRIKRRGKYIGSWRISIKGREVNLLTKDATEAKRRAQLAARGLWPSEEPAADALNKALDIDVQGGSEPTVSSPEPVPGSPPGPATLPLPEGHSEGAGGGELPAPPPAKPDGVVPPPGNWAADATAAAAEETGDAAGAGEAPPAEGLGLDDLLQLDPAQLAEGAVAVTELVLARIITARSKGAKRMRPVDPEFLGRVLTVKSWEITIRRWSATGWEIHPGWGILAGSIAMASAAFMNAETIKPPVSPGGMPETDGGSSAG